MLRIDLNRKLLTTVKSDKLLEGRGRLLLRSGEQRGDRRDSNPPPGVRLETCRQRNGGTSWEFHAGLVIRPRPLTREVPHARLGLLRLGLPRDPVGAGDLAAQVETDLNIATGLDITASVGRDEEWLERFGTARGWPRKPSPRSPGRAAMAGSASPSDRSGGLAWRDRWGL